MSHYDVLDAIDRLRKVLKTEEITAEQYADLLQVTRSARIDPPVYQTSRLVLTSEGVFLRNQATRDRAIVDFAANIVESDHP